MINGFDKLRQEIQTMKEPVIQRLCAGNFTSLDEFKNTQGYLKGLIAAESALNNIYKQLFDTTQKDNQHERTDQYAQLY